MITLWFETFFGVVLGQVLLACITLTTIVIVWFSIMACCSLLGDKLRK